MRLGPYEITAPIGRGGMGEVYRATDTNLSRQVAIKVLPAAMAADSDRIARFDREAKTLAALNHPNIAAIYGLERSEGRTALVMELVEGPTLADRIGQGAIPIDEAVAIARQMAEALEAAHDRGIVHRDLKPANIKLRPDGTVKVLDFGLAKALEPATAGGDPSQSPTMTSPAMTGVGVLLGTAAYMAPEQARGKTVDKRADIWAFGCVLYEMLTGARVFGGNEITDTIAFLITKEPDWSALPPETPTDLRRLLRRCLEKDPRNRLHDIADARLELHEVSVPSDAGPATHASVKAGARWLRAVPWALTMLTVLVAAVVIWRTQTSPPAERSVVRFTVTLPPGTLITPAGGIAVSRDGSRIAYVAGPRFQIYVRAINGVESTLLPDTAGASWLSFSPDGQSISYVDPRALHRVAVDGGRSVRLADVSTAVSPPVQHWRSDDTILFTSKGVLFRVPAAGGTPERIGQPDGEPYMLPRVRLDGPTVFAFSGTKGAVDLDLQRGTLAPVHGPGWPASARTCVPEFVPARRGSTNGFRICYDSQAGALLAAPFDAARFESTGELRTVVEGVQPIVGPFGAYAVSESGTLAYVQGNYQGAAPSTPVWVSRTGAEERLPVQERRIESIALSPNGQHIAMQVYEGDFTASQRDIWAYDVVRGTTSRLTFEGARGTVWTHDGTRIVHAFRNEIRTVSVDGGTLTRMADAPQRWVPVSMTRDESSIAGIGRPGDAPHSTVSVIRVGNTGNNPQPFMDLPQFSENEARFSPDGRFIAYSSDKTGRAEIYVASYPPGQGEWTVSSDGGTAPRWRADGRELFYRSGKRMIAVAVETSGGFRAGAAKVLFEREVFGGPDEPYDVSADGQRFLMLEAAATTTTSKELRIIVNWIDELKRLVGTN